MRSGSVRHQLRFAYKNSWGIIPDSMIVRSRCAIKILVLALSRRVELIFLMSSVSVCVSNAEVCRNLS